MKPSANHHPLRVSCLARLLSACGLVFFLSGAQAQLPAEPPLVKPTSKPWDSGKGFAFEKKETRTRKALSGIACTKNAAQERVCLMVFDEGWQARFATLGNNKLIVHPESVELKDPELKDLEKEELDAEGAATDGSYLYVTGSHSAKRGGCEENIHSRYVIRFPLDPATGLAKWSPNGKLIEHDFKGDLWSIMQSLPELKKNVREGNCGLDVEGLAVSNGRLYFGFRSPAAILSVDAHAFFTNKNKDPEVIYKKSNANVTFVQLGAGRGIRDMVAAKDGFLLLTGPDDNDNDEDPVNWRIDWWDGRSVAAKSLAELDLRGLRKPRTLQKDEPRECKDECERKPEAITVLDETPQAYKLLILSDGMCDGGAMTFTVNR